MGNPKASVATAPPSIDSGNGIFALVPGEYIAAGAQTLPPPQTMPGQTVQVEADGGHVGRIVITYVSHSYRHHKSTHWHWRPLRVDLTPTADDQGALTAAAAPTPAASAGPSTS